MHSTPELIPELGLIIVFNLFFLLNKSHVEITNVMHSKVGVIPYKIYSEFMEI